jgi:hypothetical protein
MLSLEHETWSIQSQRINFLLNLSFLRKTKTRNPSRRSGPRRDKLDDEAHKELRRKKLCFSCKEPWEPGHRCMGKGKVHYIEVLSDSDGEEEAGQAQGNEHNSLDDEQPHEEVKGGTIATLSGVPRFHTFRIRGVLQGQRVTVLIDGGATHNFIDSTLVARRGIPAENFEGFSVVVVDGYNMTCTQKVPQLDVTLGNYTVTDDFYVVELADTNVILGVQWLYSLGKHSQNYQTMELEFRAADGKKVVLRGMANGTPKIVSAKQMESIFRHKM